MQTRPRKLQLRELLTKVNTLQEDGCRDEEALNTISTLLNDTNEYFNSVEIKELACNTDEVLLDAKVVSTSAHVCVDAADSFDVHLDAYSIDDFANFLKKYLQSQDALLLNWSRIEDEHVPDFKKTPKFSYIYGAFETEVEAPDPSQKKTRKQTTRLGEAQKTRPDKIQTIDKEEEGVDETVRIMLSILRDAYKENDCKPVSYTNFVMDSTDFGKTVDNVFHFSFLIRDGAVKIVLDDNNIAYVKPISKSANTDTVRNKMESIQLVNSLSYEDWEEMLRCMDSQQGIYQKKKRRV